MAKQVEDIVVRLVGEGFEALDKIKGSFRELGKVTNLAEKDILSARDSLLDYARKAGNTEAVNKGLGDAFKGLRSQVDLCSDAYRVLSADLRQIDEVSRGATQSVMAQRQAVLASTTAGTQNVAALQQQRAALIALRAQTRDASTAFDQFSADIQAVETRLDNLADVNRRFNAVLSQGTARTAAGARVQLEALTAGIALRRQDLADIDTRSARERNLSTTIEQRIGIEQRLNTALSMRRRIQFQEGARTGREGARTGAATFNDPTVTAGFLAPDRIAQRLGDLPNTTAGLSQELGELNERLINTYRNTETYIAVQLRLSDVQRQVSAATQGFGAALRAQLDTGTMIPSQKNLAEVIGELRREMLELDTTTTEGAQAYANNARQANQLETQLRELAGAYQEVGTTATMAATAEQNAANARIRNNYLGRGAVVQQEQALRELGSRVQQGVAATPLLLPAAGQTSAPGTGQARSGGARNRLVTAATADAPSSFVAGVEATFTESLGRRLKTAGERSGYFKPPTAAVGAPPAVGFAEGAGQRDSLNATAEAARATEQQMQRLRAAVDTATKANTGSVSSLGRLREALVNLRNEIPGTEKEFRDLNQQVEGVDTRSSRLQTRRRPSTGQLVQAGGAAISGGIFGGPEGFLGGVAGGVLGTVLPGIGTAGGAFAGAAIGAQAGMFRQQLGGTADYAASIGKLQIALRGVVGSQAAYDAAIRAAAAATRDLNIPQEEATRGLTRLSAAVIGAGGTVADSSFAFRAMSEAIKATGGNAEQVDGALLALTQVFSKGKVSAEELNQIAERLPGTFTLFAQAAGKTGPELQKALEQGQVGLNDLMKFLALTGERYGATALEIAGSSQDAGARLTVAFQQMRLEVGNALQPLGADLQGTFAVFLTDITPAVVAAARAFVGTANAIGGATSAFMAFTAPMRDFFTTGIPAYAQTVKAFWSSIKNDLDSFWSRIGGFFTGLQNISYTVLKAMGIDVKGLGSVMQTVATNVTKMWSYVFNFIKGRWRETVSNMINYSNPLLAGLKVLGIADVGKAVTKGIEAGAVEISPIFKIPGAKPPVDTGLSTFVSPVPEDKDKTARDKARRDAEAAAADQQRLNEANAQAQIRLSEAVFRAQTDFDRKRFDLQQELISRERDLRIAALTGVAAETASQTAQFFRTVDELRQRATQAAVDTTASQRALQNATFMRSVTAAPAAAGGASGGAPRIGGFTPQQLSSATTAASKFTGIANMCSESVKAFYKSLGITLPGVTAWADTVRKSGQVMTDWSKLQAGDIVATGRPGDTPHVGVYTGGNNVFHQSRKRGLTAGNYPDLDYFRSGYFVRPTAAAGRQATGVASQQRRNVADQGDVAIAQVDFDMAVKYKDLLEDMVQKRLPQEVQLYALEGAKAYNAQSQALRDNVAELEKRQMLEMSSTRQEVVDGELQKFQLTRTYTREIAQLNEDLKQKEVLEDPTGVKAAGINARIAATTQAYADQKIAVDELTAAQIKFNDAQRFRKDDRIGLGVQEGVQAYVESIGTMRDATKDLTLNGIKGVENAIFDLVTTGKTNFREFAADILRQTARMIIQQLVLGTIMRAIGGITGFSSGGAFGGGAADPLGAGGAFWNANGNAFTGKGVAAYAMGGTFAKNNIIPYAKGGTFTNSVVSKPTLFKFAAGGTMQTGVMGEAGPEAIMPLSRGPNGKLGVASSGSGTTNVTVNVDASGSKAQGDSAKSEQLGRAVSQAVQDELLKQKRPGGLLA